MTVISCQDVGVRYKMWSLSSVGFKTFVLGKYAKKRSSDFWANRHITFSLEKGDMLGIIGRNGSGKSTLLKAISGVLAPTEGIVRTEGVLAALIELSGGFDQDMTVRENTFLRGAMLGFSKEFITEKYDEIIQYAELEDFQDYRFDQLSSGMKSRLGFSIACLINPDILILDEVFSVGDGGFRKKSGERMKAMLKSKRVTGLLVSHSSEQVRELCNKVLWLDHGQPVIFTDDVARTCDAYEHFMRTKILPQTDEDYTLFAQRHQERAKRDRARDNDAKMKALLEDMDEGEAVAAAVDVLKRFRPQLLKNDP